MLCVITYFSMFLRSADLWFDQKQETFGLLSFLLSSSGVKSFIGLLEIILKFTHFLKLNF